ncbi:MAG: NAD(P)/FAD-dependent oxidoreductase [Candidatus Delongbacteria bacterium]|nr:NAD(P)/FAD-dependent oxidoreductase [Candidatus Delongbacteria bacterium]MCG2761325.1 NAD(P)/FAD-dependent oxidoreductase [Candidatus Delongbacteria bacterium]
MKIGIIGGGAAGFFSAIAAKENHPDAEVTILEKSNKLLSKVKISGGGRCNVTNGCSSVDELCNAYPRGGKSLKKMFYVFSNKDAMQWFESRGVPLVTQDDNCVFPKSQNSQSIIDCFLKEADRLNIKIELDSGAKAIKRIDEKLELHFINEELPSRIFDKVIVATGGSPKRSGLRWLEETGHTIENPVPSLFSFNMPSESITDLMGIVVENTLVNIQGTKLKAAGSLLVTHWGMSGPVILKLSSFGAEKLHEKDYNFNIRINWVNEPNNETVIQYLKNIMNDHSNKILSNYRPYALPERLWVFLLDKYGIPADKKWGELGNKNLNKLTEILTNEEYSVNGKSTFKEEFVTCGGVSLKSIDLSTMQSKVCKNLYFAGEVLNIDAITGGYNFQSAWTTGFIAGKIL